MACMNCVWKQRIDSVMHNAGGEITVKKKWPTNNFVTLKPDINSL